MINKIEVGIFRRSQAFREELKLQRQTVFGKRRYWFHIAAWLMVGAIAFYGATQGDLMQGFKTGFRASQKHISAEFDTRMAFSGAMAGAVLASIITYTYLLYIIPLAQFRRQRRVLWLGLLANIFVYFCLIVVVGIILGYASVKNKDLDLAMRSVAFFSFAMMTTISLSSYFFSVYYFMDLYDQQRALNRYQSVLKDRLEAESNFLKMQINPHFLFNTLNNIYSLSLHHDAQAGGTARKLKSLVEYMLYDCAKEKVPLEGELDFLRNYIALEELRTRKEDVGIKLQIDETGTGKDIPPLLLVNFIENAFKHGVKSGTEKSFVNIYVGVKADVLQLNVTNSKPPQQATELQVKESGGIGIRNVSRRLEMLYPAAHRLRITQTKDTYSVDLKIKLA